jgi:hypothetical protein
MPESPTDRDYRKVVRRLFTIIGQGTEVSWLAIRVGYREIARLEGPLGAEQARRLHRDEALAWHTRTGRDPWTGLVTPIYRDDAA